jgi:hypothetical protein
MSSPIAHGHFLFHLSSFQTARTSASPSRSIRNSSTKALVEDADWVADWVADFRQKFRCAAGEAVQTGPVKHLCGMRYVRGIS